MKNINHDLDAGGGNGVATKKKRNSQSYKTLYEEQQSANDKLLVRTMFCLAIAGLEFLYISISLIVKYLP